MRAPLAWCVAAAVAAPALSAQTVEVGVVGVAVGDRGDVGTGVAASSGLGVGGTALGRAGRFTVEARGHLARMSGAEGGDARDVRQLALHGRYRLVPVVAVEVSAVARTFAPDPDGTGLGFVSAGVRSDFPIAGRGRLWGRVAYAPGAVFSGGGRATFGMDLGLGFALNVLGDRLLVIGRYDFQRIDRRVEGTQTPRIGSRSSVEVDVLELGVSLALSRRTPPPGGAP